MKISKFKDKLTAEELLELEEHINGLQTEIKTKEELAKKHEEKLKKEQETNQSLRQENGKLYTRISTQYKKEDDETDKELTLEDALAPFKK